MAVKGRERKGVPLTVQLQKAARGGNSDEACITIKEGRSYRISAGLRFDDAGSPGYFIEFIVLMATGDGGANLALLEHSIRMAHRLESEGVRLVRHEEGSLSCEMPVGAHELAPRLRNLIEMAEGKADYDPDAGRAASQV